MFHVKHLLCRIGLHKTVPVLTHGTWRLDGKRYTVTQMCSRCGKWWGFVHDEEWHA